MVGLRIAAMDSSALDLATRGLPGAFLAAGWLVLGLFAWAWWRSEDWRVLADPARRHLFFVSVLALFALWQIHTEVRPGLAFHLYGIAVLTVMFGFWRAVVAGVAVLVLCAGTGRIGWVEIGIDAARVAILPALVAWYWHRFLERRLPQHFFVYALGNGFAGAWLSVATIGVATTALMAAGGVYSTAYLYAHYTPYATLLVSWGEAFLSGMAVTVLAVYKPHWLETFDDARYIQNQ